MPAVTSVVIIGNLTVGALLTTMAVSYALSYVVSNFLTPKVGGGSGQQKDPGVRSQVPPDTTTAIPVVYGNAFLGGKFVDAALTTDQKVMYYVMAISCISVDGFFTYNKTKMYYGDRLITFSNVNPSTVASLTDGAGNVDTSVADLISISLFTSDAAGNVTNHTNPGQMPWGAGNAVMGADSGLASEFQWTSTGRRMNGLAFAIIRLSFNRDASTTQLQPITFNCTQNLFDANRCLPGSVWYDYMLSPIYGAAVPSQYLDNVSAQTLDTYSLETITFTDYEGDPATQQRYSMNGVINASDNVLKNVDQILTCCDSWMQYNATTGKWAIIVNKAESPSYSFNDSNIVGSINVGSVDITQMVNQVEGKFPDNTNRDQYNYVNLKVPTGLLLPNEPVNKLNISYDLVNNSVQALYLINRVIEQAREDLLVTIDTTYDGIQVEAGDVVSLTNAAYGWNNKLFRAMQVKESVVDSILTAQIQLTEYNAAVYDNFDINQYTPAPNSGVISSNFFSALAAPVITNQLPNAAIPSFSVVCTMPTTGRITTVVLYYTTVSTPTASDWELLGAQSSSNSVPFINGGLVTFTNISLPTNTYYFAFKVSNEVGSSNLSPASTAYTWLPNPTTSAVAGTFVATFSPSVLQVPYDGTSPVFTGVIAQLYGTTSGGSVDFVDSQSDSDPLFVANTWRIGGSSTTGYSNIVKTNITIANPTDGGSFALFPIPTAMPNSPATLDVPVRFKDSLGNVVQGASAILQYTYNIKGQAGNVGNHYGTALLYQWATATPSNPNGTSTFVWATNSNTAYTGTNGWSVTIPANPGIPLARLYSASKGISAVGSDVTTSVDWSTGFAVQAVSENGAAGLQVAQPTVFQWAITIPSGPTGTSTYTWANSTFTPTPAGWSLTPGTSPSAGYTLWGATVVLTDSATVTTSTINWVTASISARGFSGQSGASARICYSKTTLSALASTPTTISTSGNTTFPPNDSWGAGTVWEATPQTIVAGESVYQSDGIYNPVTDVTVWNVPYLSNLKVGSLSAISANLGTINAGSITGVTITGGTIRTAASGSRLEMTGSDNYLKAYNASNVEYAAFGGTTGVVFANGRGRSILSGPVGAFYGDFDGGNYPSTDVPVLFGTNDLGNGIQGSSQVNGVGIFGTARVAGGSNHGVRGINTALVGGGVSTGGLVGSSIGFDFYADGAGTNYGPFTGAHDVMVSIDQNIPIGYIVVDVKCLIKKNISNTIFEVAMSSTANQVPIGIMVLNNGPLANMTPAAFVDYVDYSEENPHTVLYPEYDLYKNDYNYCAANAVGEGQVYICGENGNIAAGDLIVTSSTPGVGMKQSDGIVRNITVAKAREAITFTDTTTPVLVACIYLCG